MRNIVARRIRKLVRDLFDDGTPDHNFKQMYRQIKRLYKQGKIKVKTEEK